MNMSKSKSVSGNNSFKPNNWNYEDYKKLEELFAWATFYRVNKQDKKYAQAQEQINEMRLKLGFN